MIFMHTSYTGKTITVFSMEYEIQLQCPLSGAV